MTVKAHMAGVKVLRIEIQEHAVSPADRRRPTVPVQTDTHQSAQSSVVARIAEARGGATEYFTRPTE